MKKKKKLFKVFKGSDVTPSHVNEVGYIIAPVEGVEFGMFQIILNEGGELVLLDMSNLVVLTLKSFIEKHGHKDFQKHSIIMFEVD